MGKFVCSMLFLRFCNIFVINSTSPFSFQSTPLREFFGSAPPTKHLAEMYSLKRILNNPCLYTTTPCCITTIFKGYCRTSPTNCAVLKSTSLGVELHNPLRNLSTSVGSFKRSNSLQMRLL